MKSAKKKIWVSGSRGFIGKYLLAELKNYGYDAYGVTNNQVDNKDLIYLNYSSRSKIKDTIVSYGVPDTFIHLGWGSVYQPELDVHLGQNVDDAKNLTSVLFDSGLERFILLGSSSEYGSQTGKLSENMPSSGQITNYASGKLSASRFGLNLAHQLGKAFIHVKLFYTFGAGQRSTSLINQLYSHAQTGQIMNLSPCLHYRDYIYISDVIKGLILLSQINESGVVNLGKGEAIQLRDYVILFWKHLGRHMDHLNFGDHRKPQNEPEQPLCYADLSKLKLWTNWEPTVSIEEGIKKTIVALSAQ